MIKLKPGFHLIATIAVIAAIAEKKNKNFSDRSDHSDHMKLLSSDRSDNNRWDIKDIKIWNLRLSDFGVEFLHRIDSRIYTPKK